MDHGGVYAYAFRIGSELRRARAGGKPLAPERLSGAEALLSLLIVAEGPSLPESNAMNCLRSVVRELGPLDRRVASVCLGMTTDSASQTMVKRNALIAQELCISPDTWRTEREGPFMQMLGARIIERNEQYLRMQSLKGTPMSSPLESKLRIDWLDRLALYMHCQTAAMALKVDIDAFLRIKRGDVRRAPLSDYMLVSLYWLTVVMSLDEQRVARHGGAWILATQEIESQAADCFYSLSFRLAPFTEREASRLRLLLSASTDREIEPFVVNLQADEPELVTIWHRWLDECICGNLDSPVFDCVVHELLDQVDAFASAIQTHANLITDWYLATTEPPTDVTTQPWK